jgi:hypothetical protein
VVAPGKSWSNFVVVTTLPVDGKVGIVDYWSAKEWSALGVSRHS